MWSKVDPHARHGLTLALDRLEQARRSESDWFAATGEAIFWLMLADELNWYQPDYPQHLLVDPGGPRIYGFRYLWNLVKHYPITEVIEFAPGAMGPMRFPVTWWEGTWKLRQDLPPLGGKYRANPITHGQAAAYDAWVAGQLVRVTIPAAASFFDCRPSISR